jgi:hypothetical protein
MGGRAATIRPIEESPEYSEANRDAAMHVGCGLRNDRRHEYDEHEPVSYFALFDALLFDVRLLSWLIRFDTSFGRWASGP